MEPVVIEGFADPPDEQDFRYWPLDNAVAGVDLLLKLYRDWMASLRTEDYERFRDVRGAIIEGLSGVPQE